MQEPVITVKSVYKDFKINHSRSLTIKSHFVAMLKRKTANNIETQHALKDINFEIKKGEFFGIVGRNGSGKSTLLKMLAGIYQPTQGTINVSGKLVPFIELGVGFNPELTGKENVFLNGALLGFSENEVAAFYNEVVAFAELEQFMDKKLKNYSSGMQVRLAFSMAVQAKADILLVDEVLAVGDADFQRKCFEYFRLLKKQKKTVVFVSHDMNAVREYCDKAILIENYEISAAGTPNKIASQYNKLFIDKIIIQNTQKGNTKTRWGNKMMEFIKIDCPTKLYDEEQLSVTCKIKVNQDMTEPIIGFSIKNSADVRVFGSNTKLEGIKIKDLKKGEIIQLTWSAPNILNDGKYFINAAIETQDAEACDWWEEVRSLQVYRDSRTGFLVRPKIEAEILRNQKETS